MRRWGQYKKLRDQFLDRHSICCRCKQKIPRPLRTLHHWAGRYYALLVWVPGFRMACRECHHWIENHRKQASALGLRAPEDKFNRPSLCIPKNYSNA